MLEIREKGKAVNETRLLEVAQLNLYSYVQLSSQALKELASREAPVLHLSYSGWLSAVTTPPPHKNIELRRRQFAAANDEAFCLQLARAFVVSKNPIQRTQLRRNARELLTDTLYRMAEMRRKAQQAPALETLLGLEGTAARDYFASFSRIIKPAGDEREPAFDFETRNRHPPRDPVNVLLSFLYSLLVKEMVVTLVSVGFDPTWVFIISRNRASGLGVGFDRRVSPACSRFDRVDSHQ